MISFITTGYDSVRLRISTHHMLEKLWLLVIYKLELPKCEASSLKHKEDLQVWCCSSLKPLLCWSKEFTRTSTKQGCVGQSSNPWRWWTKKKEHNTCVWLISRTLRRRRWRRLSLQLFSLILISISLVQIKLYLGSLYKLH